MMGPGPPGTGRREQDAGPTGGTELARMIRTSANRALVVVVAVVLAALLARGLPADGADARILGDVRADGGGP